jgi:hypothetical protein
VRTASRRLKKLLASSLSAGRFSGLACLLRDGNPAAARNPQPVYFCSPDTFNFVVLDIDKSGKTTTVASVGMDSTAQNAGRSARGREPAGARHYLSAAAIPGSQARAG